MEFGKYRIKMMEAFKDGNILEGRLLKAGEFIDVSEADMVKIRNSGGIFEVMETLIPNPRKSPVVQEVLDEQAVREEEEKVAKDGEVAQAQEKIARPEPEKRKAGRPRKNA